MEPALAAAKSGDLPALRALHSQGLLPRAGGDHLGATAVHLAARSGRIDALAFLVDEAKLPGNQRARNGATPAHDAAATGNLPCLQWLLDAGSCNTQVGTGQGGWEGRDTGNSGREGDGTRGRGIWDSETEVIPGAETAVEQDGDRKCDNGFGGQW